MREEHFTQAIIAIIVLVMATLAFRACGDGIKQHHYNRFKDCMKETKNERLCMELFK